MSLFPTQVTLCGLKPSDLLESDIRARVEWLEKFYGRIVRCHVGVDVSTEAGTTSRVACESS